MFKKAMQTDKSARTRTTMDDQLCYRNPAPTPGLVFRAEHFDAQG